MGCSRRAARGSAGLTRVTDHDSASGLQLLERRRHFVGCDSRRWKMNWGERRDKWRGAGYLKAGSHGRDQNLAMAGGTCPSPRAAIVEGSTPAIAVDSSTCLTSRGGANDAAL